MVPTLLVIPFPRIMDERVPQIHQCLCVLILDCVHIQSRLTKCVQGGLVLGENRNGSSFPICPLLREFLATGAKAQIVATKAALLDEKWLGRTLSEEMLPIFESLRVDPCGERGEYHVLGLPAGQYVLRVQQPGFRLYRQSGITLRLADRTALDVKLEVGQPSQSVDVHLLQLSAANAQTRRPELQTPALSANGRTRSCGYGGQTPYRIFR